MSKSSRFKRPFDKHHGKWSQTLLKLVRQNFCHFYWSLSTKLSCKKSLLVINKILGLFVNILTVIDKYFPLNIDDLMQPNQMESSKKQKKI